MILPLCTFYSRVSHFFPFQVAGRRCSAQIHAKPLDGPKPLSASKHILASDCGKSQSPGACLLDCGNPCSYVFVQEKGLLAGRRRACKDGCFASAVGSPLLWPVGPLYFISLMHEQASPGWKEQFRARLCAYYCNLRPVYFL
jgi:hypothetical protein